MTTQSSVVKFCVFPGNHPEEIRKVLLESKDCEEVSTQNDQQCLKECNFIWKPTELSFQAFFQWEQNSKKQPTALKLYNHIDNTRNITTKTGIIRSLKKFFYEIDLSQERMEVGKDEELTDVFDIIPTTYIVHSQFKTQDVHRFVKRYSDIAVNEGLSLKERMPQKHCLKNMWLLKPATLNQGRGIQIFSKIKEILDFLESQAQVNSYWVIQKYIERPLLFKGRKFDIRMWVLLTVTPNTSEFNLYLFEEGYLRTSSSSYDLEDQNKYVHLTNNCLQQLGTAYGEHEAGNTLSFKDFQAYLDSKFAKHKINIMTHLVP